MFVQPASAREPKFYYDQLFGDDRFDVTIALGYEQLKTDTGIPVIGPVLDAVGDLYKSAKRDEENTVHDVDAVEFQLLSCRECGFRVDSRKKGERIYSAPFKYEGREITARVRFIYSVSGVKREALKKAFLDALKNDDAIMYIGHARNGRGFPDFSSPLSDTGKIFVDDEFGGWLGFEKGLFSPTKYQILSVHACQTDRYFTKAVRERVWEKDPSKLALLMTGDDSWFDDYPGTTVALIRGIMLQAAREQLLFSLELAAPYYRNMHRADEVKKPLFRADGFFDDTYAKAKRPKRKVPREQWRDMPF